jgi:predicted membrane chloride channel (bestrophin family)
MTIVERRDHLAELRLAASNLGRGTGANTERWLLTGGAALVPIGLVLVVLGYWGAAHVPREIQQVPYLISGGILGLALVFAGGFAYFGYWLTRILREQIRIVDKLEEQTERLTEELRSLRS